MPDVVRAAGGVVVRLGASREPRVLVVHRPRYDDWSFPKGKVDPGETEADAAVREVEEETGLRCTLVDELGTTRYRDRKGRPKRVQYWLMTVALGPDRAPGDAVRAGRFVPNDEVDEIRWCRPGEAATMLTYDHDRELLARSLARLESPR